MKDKIMEHKPIGHIFCGYPAIGKTSVGVSIQSMQQSSDARFFSSDEYNKRRGETN